ncbi:class F sortase [Arthrobacter sp. C152]
MPKERSKHAAAPREPRRRWNRGDLAILLCGVLSFLSFTVGAPLFHTPAGGGTSAAASARFTTGPAVATLPASPEAATPSGPASTDPASAAATGLAAAGQTTAPAPVLPASAPPVRISYPAAAFDVAIHPLDLDGASLSSRTIEPPATKDGYWLAAFGAPGSGSTNTTYVIGHSWVGADAPFNHLSSAAAVGDVFDVGTAAGTIRYRVENISTYDKSSLKDGSLWDMVPNRLVLVSCFTEDPWGTNVVVTAYPSASQP